MSDFDDKDKKGIINVDISDSMKDSYIDYAMSVIVARAIPDVRDGFKPVHRRVIFGMHELGVTASSAYKKSARIVGEVMGKFHPHGDSSVYDTMVRMAQDWSLRYKLVDGQGNFGSVDGDSPAAMRYTEARMSKIAMEFVNDLEKETVDFQKNFDDTLDEPKVMPTKIPNLLVNGSSGIAVGMATNMLPHNLNESIDGCIAYIENRDITIEELMQHVKAPDFPTGGVIYGIDGVKEAFETGRGKVVVRGRAEIEVENNRESIIITEIPYQVNKAKLHVQISELVNEGKIEGISDVRDESDRNGMRLVIELRRDAITNVVLNRLFQMSQLQTSYGVNNIALVNGRPELLNLKQMIHHFIEFRHDVVTRRTQFELRKAEARAHIVEGLIIAVDNIDEVIEIIKKSPSQSEAQRKLEARFTLSELQSKAIIDMRLGALTGLEIDKLKDEFQRLMDLIAKLKEILSDVNLRMQIIKDELMEMKEKFGDARKTDIIATSGNIDILDIIANEQVVVTISHLGYIKRTSLEEYREQNRGGRGAKGSKSRTEDFTEHLFIANTHNVLLLFTSKGRCYWINVYEIPEGNKTSMGRAIQNLMNIAGDEKILAYLPIENLKDEQYINSHYVFFCTKNGVIKKTLLEEFSRPRQNGVAAITIREGDELLDALLTNGKMEMIIASKEGKALRFNESKVRSMGRTAAGVTGMDLGDNASNEIVGIVSVDKDSEIPQTVLVVSEKGFGKRTYIDDPEDGEAIYRVTNRGGKGVKTLNITEKTGDLIAILNVIDGNHLMIINKSGIAIRLGVDKMRIVGRATQGVTLIKLDKKDSIAAVAKVVADEDEDLDDNDTIIDDASVIDTEEDATENKQSDNEDVE
ncbi:MAG: DNA gyrase subunit A [Chitinophagales bacterium]|jgi:DNA gyrase subunit A|nr:DNA gyrase subunit A [Sphingobacteriales bacterium]